MHLDNIEPTQTHGGILKVCGWVPRKAEDFSFPTILLADEKVLSCS